MAKEKFNGWLKFIYRNQLDEARIIYLSGGVSRHYSLCHVSKFQYDEWLRMLSRRTFKKVHDEISRNVKSGNMIMCRISGGEERKGE